MKPLLPFGARVAVSFANAGEKSSFVRALLAGAKPALVTPESALLGEAAALRPIGYVSPGATLLSGFSVADNLRIPVQTQDLQGAEPFPARARSACAIAGIDPELLAADVSQLDRLGRIRATFVQALIREPELLVLDAVFEGLGEAEQRQVARLAEGFHRRYLFRRSLCLGYASPSRQLYPATAEIRMTEGVWAGAAEHDEDLFGGCGRPRR